MYGKMNFIVIDFQGFGRADHQKSVDVLKEKYTDYEITFSNDGY